MTVKLRVASFNAQSFRAGVEAAARALASDRPDLVLVQECGPRRRLRRFAGAMGLEVASSHRPFNRVRNAVLYPSTWRLMEFQARDFTREGRTLRRGLIASQLRRSGTRLVAVAAHLGLSARERRRHARELTDYLSGLDSPLVLGVDMNEGADGDAMRWVAGRLFDAWATAGTGSGDTFPARSPTARIDYVFLSAGINVTTAWVGEGEGAATASDHRPVIAEIRLPEP